VARSALLRLSRLSQLRCSLKNALPFTPSFLHRQRQGVMTRFATKRVCFFSLVYNDPKFSYNISPSFIFLKSYKIISKSGMRLEVLMGNKISEKFVLTNEGSLIKLKKEK
jgi:hypothetical protein